MHATSNAPRKAAGSGSRRSCRTISTATPVPAVCAATQDSTSGSESTTVSRRISPGAWVSAANLAIATEMRSSSPRMMIRLPSSAPASCMASTRLIFVATVQCV